LYCSNWKRSGSAHIEDYRREDRVFDPIAEVLGQTEVHVISGFVARSTRRGYKTGLYAEQVVGVAKDNLLSSTK
jgi:hypothetical protein